MTEGWVTSEADTRSSCHRAVLMHGGGSSEVLFENGRS